MSSALTLAEIIRRNVAVEWHEGVALVRAVIERLRAQHDPTPDIPELHDIELAATGRIDILGGTPAADPVRRLGQLLQATLGQAEPPVQLRLVITQATAPATGFGTIREFDEVLGYYERPNREGVLQALYERAAAMPAIVETRPVALPTLDTVAPLPKPEAPKKRARPPLSSEEKRRQRRLALAAVVLIGLIVAGVQYLRMSSTEQREAEVSALAAKASDAVGSAVVTGLSAVTQSVGLGRIVEPTEPAGPAPAASEPAPADAMPKPGAPGTRRPAPTPLAVGTQPLVFFDLEARPGVSRSPALDVAVAGTSSNGGERPAPALETGVFSPSDDSVEPPIGIRPQLPRELPPDVRPEDLTRIELIVAPDGTVETVRLISSPKNVHDSMWLSAIKAWQFQPAMKNGQPVRYLKTVWIAHR